MGRDLQNITQYQLTNDIVKNHFVFGLKDGALKVLLILSTHFPNILIQRKSLINRYKIPQRTVDRAIKELEEKQLIERQNGSTITLNVANIYCHIGNEKVVNMANTCMNKQEITKKDNKHDNNDVVVSLLKDFSFSDDEIHQLVAKHSIQSLQMYAKFVQLKNTQTPKKYLLWCLREKPALSENNKTDKTATKQKYNNDAERYSTYMTSTSANWMNNIEYAQTFLCNTSQFDLRNETVLKDCIAIMLRWELQINDYSVLMLIDEAAATNEAFKQKTVKLTAQVMNDLKTAKLAAAENGEDCKQIAC